MKKSECISQAKAFYILLFKKYNRRDWKDKVNFKIYDVATWLTNSCTTHIAQYLKK